MRRKIMRIKTFLIVVALSFGALFLYGCQSTNTTVVNSSQDVSKVSVALSDSAQSIDQSLQELSAMERADHPAIKMPNPLNPEMIGMAQIISIDWNGPIEPLLKKLTELTHYRLHILGTRPAIPIIVSITKHQVPLAEVVRDANFQCQRHANVAVYAANRVIELRYARN
jgi:defect in organelle trafficking protein DotD